MLPSTAIATKLDDEQQQRARGREEKENGEKQDIVGGLKQPNAGVVND